MASRMLVSWARAEEEVMGKAAYIQAFHADDLKNFEA